MTWSSVRFNPYPSRIMKARGRYDQMFVSVEGTAVLRTTVPEECFSGAYASDPLPIVTDLRLGKRARSPRYGAQCAAIAVVLLALALTARATSRS